MTDVIDTLAGIAADSALDKARDNRPEARKHAQASYDALFKPKDLGSFSALERFAVAAFVAGLHGRQETKDFYAGKLAEAGASPELRVVVASGVVTGHANGPSGSYPPGPPSPAATARLVYAIRASHPPPPRPPPTPPLPPTPL